MASFVPDTLLETIRRYPSDRRAFTELSTGERLTYGELTRLARHHAAGLQSLGLAAGDRLLFTGDDYLHLMPLLVAAMAVGLDLFVQSGRAASGRKAEGAQKAFPKLIVGAVPLPSRRPHDANTPRQLSLLELAQLGADQPCTLSVAGSLAGRLGGHSSERTSSAELAWISHAALGQTAACFAAAHPLAATDTLLTAASGASLEALCLNYVTPMALGLHAALISPAALDDPAALWAGAHGAAATICQIPAAKLQRLLTIRSAAGALLPEAVRRLLIAPGLVPAELLARAENTWHRPVDQGVGTASIGYWAVSTRSGGLDQRLHLCQAALPHLTLAIRPLRKPLDLLAPTLQGETGELVFHQTVPSEGESVPAAEQRTGYVGQLAEDGSFLVRGRLADIAIKSGRGVLLTEIDAVLGRHPRVTASKTIHENGQSPVERVVAACVTDLPAADLLQWCRANAGPQWTPDEIIPLAWLPKDAAGEASAATLRAIISGTAAHTVCTSLTERKFRRSPCYKPAELRDRVQAAILHAQPVRFMALWGCGPRQDAGLPDLLALAALRDLMDTVCAAAPVGAHLDVVCTDVHASCNGHSIDHFESYFAQVKAAAARANMTFHRESHIWEQGGLSLADVRALARSPDFHTAWQQFPLRDRFLLQASRHSKSADHEAAARQYYASCLLERHVLKAAFSQAIFLTYNGPEFNSCFPDLPTLYIYPGPRGRTVKPWFADGIGAERHELDAEFNVSARPREPSFAAD